MKSEKPLHLLFAAWRIGNTHETAHSLMPLAEYKLGIDRHGIGFSRLEI